MARSPTKKIMHGDLVSWALDLLDRIETNAICTSSGPPCAGDDIEPIVARFGLSDTERAIFALLVAAERSLSVARRLRTFAGGPQVTVEAVRDVLAAGKHDGVVGCLVPRASLRAHALVCVANGVTRLVAANDAIRVEVGLVPRVAPGAELDELTIMEPTSTDEKVAFVQRLGGKIPAVIALELATPGSEASIARAIADGTRRRTVWWNANRAEDVYRVLRLRRDVDLEGAVLVVSGVVELGPLLGAPPAHPVATPLIVLLDVKVAEKDLSAPWTLRRDRVLAETNSTERAPLTDIDRIRLLAQRDADRALGITRPMPPPRLIVPGRIVDASVRVAEVVVTEPPIVEAAAPIVEAAVVEPELTAIAPASVVDDGPRLDIAADAPPDARARAAMQSPSTSQRIELMESLAGLKSSVVVAALRHNAKSEHAGLRQVAETLMTKIFGATWNRSRAIAPPVQSPPSDDGGRGPHGAT